jgi:exosome complex component RRP41
VEISKVLNEALSNVIFFDDYPKTGIDVFVEILEAEASTRCAGLNAASLALSEAGVSMKNLISACTAGKVDGQIVLDVGGDEDQFGDVDLALATVGNEDKIVLLQMDGVVTKEEFLRLVNLARKGSSMVYEKQVSALREKYKTGEQNVESE